MKERQQPALPEGWHRVVARYAEFRSWPSWRGRDVVNGRKAKDRWSDKEIEKWVASTSERVLELISAGDVPEQAEKLVREQATLDAFLVSQDLSPQSTKAWAEAPLWLSTLWKALILDRDDYRCGYCGRQAKEVYEAEQRTLRLELDHRLAQSKKGCGWKLDNITTACRSCNVMKGQMEEERFRKELLSLALAVLKKSG